MTHNEIEQYLSDKELNTFEYQLAMDAMLFAEQKTIERAREWLQKYFVVDHYGMSPSGFCVFANMFRKAMEEQL